MSDYAPLELPRVALVFGEEAAAAHVREAMHGHAEIVYAASAGEFDASRVDGARAALVNLDDGDWLDSIETKLNAAGVTVVFNDPEISRKLEGWERARWLRHLLAKLRGCSDVDPPRPGVSAAAAADAVDTGVSVASTPKVPTAPADVAVFERPLSPEEIETMTADFVAEQETASASTPGTSSRPPVDTAVEANAPPMDARNTGFAEDMEASPATEAESPAPMQASAAAPETDTWQVVSPDDGFDAEGALDVDTEALSAMIDARLAEPGSEAPSDSPQVWRVVSGGVVPPVQLETLAGADLAAPGLGPSAAPVATAQDDADVLASLPSLDDWQLVDVEIPAAPAASAHPSPEPTLPDSIAGLELVPIETVAPILAHKGPFERGMHDDSQPAKPGAAPANAARHRAGGKP